MEQDRDWHYLCPIFGTNSVPCKDALGALSCCKGCLHNALAAHSNRFCALESSRLGYPACPGAASRYRPQLFPNTAWFGSRARFASELQHLLKAPSFPGCSRAVGSPRAVSLVLLHAAHCPAGLRVKRDFEGLGEWK